MSICMAANHGLLNNKAREQHDPMCSQCIARQVLAEHDHLHLSGPCPDGLTGPLVRCKCGAFHGGH